MAIDLIVTDKIDAGIETRLLSMANAAEALEKRANAAQRALNGIGGSKLSDIASRTLGMGTGGKSVESAYVTATKDLNKQRADIARAIETGFAARERQSAKIVAQIEKASKNNNALKSISSAPVSSAATLKSQQAMYNGLFGAHNISTSAPTQNLANVISQTTGTALTQASKSTIAQKQQFYNNLFGAHNISTTAPAQNLAATINAITGAGMKQASQSSQRASQTMYNNLFGAGVGPATMPSSLPNVSAGASSLKSLGPSAASASAGIRNVSSAMDGLNTSASFLRSDGLRWAKVLWALGGATLTAGAIVDAADAYTRLQNRLSVVADTQQKVNALTQNMAEIAKASRQPIEQTAKTFTRVDLAMQQMGRSQADSMKITQNVAKALKLGGATAGEAASALLQMSQAFNKGKLDGDEFRSMMENSPILADALAVQLKVTRGELLKLAPAGKITATVMADAFIGATQKIDDAFKRLRPTIAEAFQNMRTDMIMFFGPLDQQIGLTAALAAAIMALGENLDVLTFAFMALAPVAAVFIGSKMIAGFGAMLAFAGRTAVAIGAIRNPIITVTVALANMARQAVVSGATVSTMFATATTRAVALQLATVRAAAGVRAIVAVAATAGRMMMAAFSFGNILMLIAVTVAALISFGDQMIVSAEKGTTMRDMTIAVFQELGAFVTDVFNGIYTTVVEVFGGVVDTSETTTERVGNSIFSIALATAVTFDAVNTVLRNFLGLLQSTIYFCGDTIYNVYTLLSNMITAAVNVAIVALNALGGIANTILQSIGSSTQFGEIGYVAGREFSTNFIDSLGSNLYGNTHVFADALTLDLIPRVKERADALAAKRKADDKLRAYNEEQARKAAAAAAAATTKGKEKQTPKSDEEKRADILKKATIEQQKLTRAAMQYGDAREVTAVLEDVNGKLAMKNYALLSATEKAHLKNLVEIRLTTERVGKQMQDMYDNVKKPSQDYMDSIEAANNLLHDRTITQDEHTAALLKSARAMKALTDPTFEYSEALAKLQAQDGEVGLQAKISAAIDDTVRKQADAGRTALNQLQVKEITDLVTAADELEKKGQALKSVWASTGEALEATVYNMDALTAQYDKGALAIDEYIRRMSALKAENGALNEQMFGLNDPVEPFRRGIYQLVAEMPTLGQSMADSIEGTLGNAIDNLSGTVTEMIMNFDAYAESVSEALNKPVSTLDTLRYGLAEVIQQMGTELISAIIKMGVQWAIQAAMQKTMAATATATAQAQTATTLATQSAAASALTAVWTAPATLASVATQGAAAVTGAASITAALAAVKASTTVMSALPAFADGSDRISGAGNGRSDSILARVSTGEMVMNKQAVDTNYPMLRAMQNGESMGSGYVDNSVHVNVTYNADGSSSTEGDMSVMAKNIAGYVKTEVRNEFSKMSRQGQSNYRG